MSDDVRALLESGEDGSDIKRSGKWFYGMSLSEKKERIKEIKKILKEIGPRTYSIENRDNFAGLFGYTGHSELHSMVSYLSKHKKEWGIDFSETTETGKVPDPKSGEMIMKTTTVAVTIGLLHE